MSEKLRIVFAYCYRNPWIEPIARDLYTAFTSLGHELFVIGGGKNDSIYGDHYIDLDGLEFNTLFYKTFKFLYTRSIDLSELVNRECKLIENRRKKVPISKDYIEKRLRLEYTEAKIIFKIIQPDVVIVWNGLLFKPSVYVKAAKNLGIPIYYAEKGMFPNSWYIDFKGVNPLSTLADKKDFTKISKDRIDDWKSKLESIDRKGESAWEQPSRKDTLTIRKNIGINNNQKVIFFPGQVDIDTNIILFSPNFKSVLDALKWLVKDLPEDEFFVLAKPHPKGEATEAEFQKVLGNKGKAILDINVLDAIKLADCIVSINSTVAFEAAIRWMPVLLLGQGILSNKSFVSNYLPGKDSCFQVKECIKKYKNNKDNLYNEAIAFTAYLDLEYYTYRKNIQKTLPMLEHLASEVNEVKDKKFNFNDIATFFKEMPYKNSKKLFPSKVENIVLLDSILNMVIRYRRQK